MRWLKNKALGSPVYAVPFDSQNTITEIASFHLCFFKKRMRMLYVSERPWSSVGVSGTSFAMEGTGQQDLAKAIIKGK